MESLHINAVKKYTYKLLVDHLALTSIHHKYLKTKTYFCQTNGKQLHIKEYHLLGYDAV
jgi:dihydrofolate reductase